jgi:hypothetical protein
MALPIFDGDHGLHRTTLGGQPFHRLWSASHIAQTGIHLASLNMARTVLFIIIPHEYSDFMCIKTVH